MDDRLFADPEDPYPEGIEGPTVDIPAVDGSDGSIDHLRDSPVVRLFVLQVVVWNLILLAASVGLLLVYFRQDWTTGGQLLGAALVLLLYSRYRWPDRGGDGQPSDA